MSDNRFKIVFDGALLPGVESTTAKLNLAELFKSDVEAIEKLFTGRTVATQMPKFRAYNRAISSAAAFVAAYMLSGLNGISSEIGV